MIEGPSGILRNAPRSERPQWTGPRIRSLGGDTAGAGVVAAVYALACAANALHLSRGERSSAEALAQAGG